MQQLTWRGLPIFSPGFCHFSTFLGDPRAKKSILTSNYCSYIAFHHEILLFNFNICWKVKKDEFYFISRE